MLQCAYAAPHLKEVTSGLKEPLWATAPKDSSRYFYILEKAGVIKIQDRRTGQVLPKAFLDISSKIKIRMNEQGLLGMAFCPNFSTTGRFYLNYTDLSGNTQIARYTCNPKLPLAADSGTEEILLSIKQDSRNHNGGWIGFGPDNFLYIAMGDGGSANDPKRRAQDLSQLLGKLLRIDVSGKKGYTIPKSNPFISTKGAHAEIYAYGLRNPWRCAWDPKTKDFYIADVGQNKIEEINFQPAGKGNGANYGWRKREGNTANPRNDIGGPNRPSYTDPVYTYKHGVAPTEGLSVTGGFVYRGKIKALQGHYFFADWVNPRIWSFKMQNGKPSQFKDWTDSFKLKEKRLFKISSFAQDPQGEIYLFDHKAGKMFQITE